MLETNSDKTRGGQYKDNLKATKKEGGGRGERVRVRERTE